MRIKSAIIMSSPFMAAGMALFWGAYDLSPPQVLDVLRTMFSGANTPEAAIILDIRLPRIILAGMAGMALSVSGATLQAVLRNPLVDPFILGISAGSAFGCAIAIGFLSWLPLQVAAFVFGGLAVLLACLMARSGGEISRLSLVLSGVIVSAFFTALLSIVKFVVDPLKLQSIVYWLMGSFALADWHQVKTAGIGILLGCFPVYLLRWRLNVISMGDDEARSLGVNVSRKRIIFIACSTLAVTSAVSVSGIIGWIGLIAPHLIRMIAGPDHRRLIPLSMAGGAAFMICADTVARNLAGLDVPVGIITALAGAPFFIYLMKWGGRESWGQ
ncbi:MAG: iron ABC transporter permease [Desulfuromonadaceae bacterium]|nr:iron ABC transporter permease [Desulfuromonadaceae bacterium]MDD5107430.1 iron ABC transporter permease [Desulfuromonadaceae bacterium]